MMIQWLNKLNLFIGLLALFFLFLALLFFWQGTEVTEPPLIIPTKKSAPKAPFAQPQEAYDAIGTPELSLNFSPMTLQLPNLRQALTYFGRNARPDADPKKIVLHFTTTSDNGQQSIPPNSILYLTTDPHKGPGTYIFSPENRPTSLWIEAEPRGDEAIVRVSMLGEDNQIITEPETNREFSIKERSRPRRRTDWEINKMRVDGSLLAKQRARWQGEDLFLNRHGGDEYSHLANKQRVDFGQEEESYSIYISPEDRIIWVGSKWKVADKGEDTSPYPLLMVRKMTDRLLTFTLWRVEGKEQMTLNLIKAKERWAPKQISDNFKFIGSRKRSQFIFEVDGKRMLIRPMDWLLKTSEGWVKLSSPSQIDAYVERKLTGPLFIFEGIVKKEDGVYLEGTLFNTSRTEISEIELPIQQGGGVGFKEITPAEEEEQEEEEKVEEEMMRVDPRMLKPHIPLNRHERRAKEQFRNGDK